MSLLSAERELTKNSYYAATASQSGIEAQLGLDASRRVWGMTIEAIELIGQRRARFGIDCDWRAGYLSLAVNARKARELQTWHAQMGERYGYRTEWIATTKVEFARGGFVDISMQRAPDFGRLPTGDGQGAHANIYYLQGFSGHGVALTGLAGKLVAEAIAGLAERFDIFAGIRQRAFPGGRLLRMPALVAGMAYYRLRDLL